MIIVVHILGSMKLIHPNRLCQNIVSSSLSCIWFLLPVSGCYHYTLQDFINFNFQILARPHSIYLTLSPFFYLVRCFQVSHCGCVHIPFIQPSDDGHLGCAYYFLAIMKNATVNMRVQTSFKHNNFNVFGKYINTLVGILNDLSTQVLNCRVKVL